MVSTFLLLGNAAAEPTGSALGQLQTVFVNPPIQYEPLPESLVADMLSNPSAATVDPPYTPADIQGAYNFGCFARGGARKAIAIVDAFGDPWLSSDLANFDSTFGIPAPSLRIYYPTGMPSTWDFGWAIETALDVEWAHALAQGATIDLIISKDNSFDSMLQCVKYAATLPNVAAISMSWGASEWPSVMTPFDAACKAIRSKGIALLAASGDWGAGAFYPASSPYVTAVGGTSLYLSGPGTYGSEVAWSWSGGGFSAYEGRPIWQLGSNPSTMRGVPDVAFDADPNTGVFVYFWYGWWQVGGTSLGSPCWAAIVADSAFLNLDSAYLYMGVYHSPKYLTEIHDVRFGSNGIYSAGPGWDSVTGIGSPDVFKLLTQH